MADWSQLPGIAVALIARRFQLIEDFVAFRRTCTSWRAATSLKDFDRSCPRLPLLMLFPPDDFDPEVVDERMFFSLSTRKICKVSLPEAREAKHCLGSKGWIVMVGFENEMSLLNPITRVQIPLPTHPVGCYPFRTAVLSASPSETSKYALMIVCKNMGLDKLWFMAFWKPGVVACWTQVESPESAYRVEHLCYYDGKFYALATPSQVLMYDVLGPNPNKATKIVDFPWSMLRPYAQLVECAGRLLVIAPFKTNDCWVTLEHDLEMVELDVMKGSYKNITSLGNSTVFLGYYDEAFSIDATKFHGVIEPNYIYFSDDGTYYAARCGRYQTDDGPGRQRNGIHLSDINGSCKIFGGVWVNI